MSSNSFAVDITGLYQAQLPVMTQTEEERKKISADVLKEVLLKVVGDSAALNSTNLTPILNQSDQFIRQYQYHRMNKLSDDLTQPDILELQLIFNEDKLNQSITELGLPIWEKSRPEVLLWLAIDNNGRRTIVAEDSIDNAMSHSLKQALTKRGLPLFMPLIDLRDQMQLSFADLWAGFSEPILKASQRYDAQIIVTARVAINENGAMKIRWQSIRNDKTEQWQSNGNDAFYAGISELADRTSRQFTQVVRNQDTQRYDLQISNVKGYADYIRVKQYLSKLHTISDVQLSNLANDKLEISILLSSDLSKLNQMIAIGRVLKEQTADHSTDVIYYKLIL
ncbi:MAG: DUF2066 domain-containing protein [Methylophaga sp.]|nr:DUF2066 domain-containing protein [Methylophaga sp.]